MRVYGSDRHARGRESGEVRQVKVGLGLCLPANAFTEAVFLSAFIPQNIWNQNIFIFLVRFIN